MVYYESKLALISCLLYLLINRDQETVNIQQIQVSAVALMNPRDALHHGKNAPNKGGCSM